jgi:hypothetical protein
VNRIFTRIALIVLGLVMMAGAGIWWYVRPRELVNFSDGAAINQSADSVRIREILWEPPVKLAQQINIPTDVYEPCLSSDGLSLYFVRGRAGKNADIFVCTRTQPGWTDAIPLAAINSPHDELGPHLAPNGRELYFYSDRPGTLGGYDLWISRKEGDTWQAPVNLGAAINSAANEYGPAISPDGKLLVFASNRPKADEQPAQPSTAWSATIREDLTRRDYDLYSVSLEKAAVSSQPLTRLNTQANEGAAAFSPFGDFLYFSSDRPNGEGGFDLYRSRILRSEFLDAENLGVQVNTPANELDPALGLGGYGLHFSSDRPDTAAPKREYQLYYSASREVFRDIHVQRTAIDWRALWTAIAPNLLWALLALLLTLLFIALLRDVKNRRLSLLAKCLIASLLLHTMLMLLFNVWQVGTTIATAIRKGPIRIGLHSGNGQGGLAGQIRGNITDVNVSIPAGPALQQGEHKLVLHTLRAMTRLPAAPTKIELTPTPMRPIRIADAAPNQQILHSSPETPISPSTPFDIALPQESHQISTSEVSQEPAVAMQGISRGTPSQSMTAKPLYISPEVQTDRSQIDLAGQGLPAHITATPSDAQPSLAARAIELAPRVAAESTQLAITLPAMPDQAHPRTTNEESDGDSAASIAAVTGGSLERGAVQARIGPASLYVVTTAPAMQTDSSLSFGGESTIESAFNEAPASPGGAIAGISSMQVAVSGGSGNPAGSNNFGATDLGRMEEAPSTGGSDAEVASIPQISSPGSLQRAPGVFSSTSPSAGSTGTGGAVIQMAPGESTGSAASDGTFALPGTGSGGAGQADAPTTAFASISGDASVGGLPTSPQLSIGMPSEQLPPENPYVQRSPEQRTPLLKQMGGNAETEKAVADALTWLAAHQSADGRWSSENFDNRCRACGGGASAEVDVAVTGLSLLCFLGADHTHLKDGPYHETVRKGLGYLRRIQQENGDLRNDESMYSHGIASICLAEAYGMTKDKLLARPVERAVDFICRARNKRAGGWRYDPGQAGDTSVLGWQIMALKSAQRGGIDVPDEAFEAGRDWLVKVNSRRQPGLYSYQPGRKATVSMTAEGMFVQSLLGASPDDSQMQTAAQYLLKSPPNWDESNTYYWYYATLALFQRQGDAWTTWNDKLVPQLLAHQEKIGRAAGSWAPVGEWAPTAGRVYQTALCALMLEVYYRYLPMYSQPIATATP